MFSVAPNILLAPNMTQNAERKHRTQDANTAHFRSYERSLCRIFVEEVLIQIIVKNLFTYAIST